MTAMSAKELAQKFLASGLSEEYITEDFRWIVPASLSRQNGGDFRANGLAKRIHEIHEQIYDVPSMQNEVHFLIGEGEWAAYEFEVRAKNKVGDDYHNQYCLTFHARDGKIDLVREHVDSMYANEVLFKPAGIE
jgi:ketosteroid isomerase-like protein